jgi:hypothetical protein
MVDWFLLFPLLDWYIFMASTVTFSHWLPIVTICPVNNLPDFIYVYLTFPADMFQELYALRKQMRKVATANRKCFMEEVAWHLQEAFPHADVEVRLLTGRHVIKLERLKA